MHYNRPRQRMAVARFVNPNIAHTGPRIPVPCSINAGSPFAKRTHNAIMAQAPQQYAGTAVKAWRPWAENHKTDDGTEARIRISPRLKIRNILLWKFADGSSVSAVAIRLRADCRSFIFLEIRDKTFSASLSPGSLLACNSVEALRRSRSLNEGPL